MLYAARTWVVQETLALNTNVGADWDAAGVRPQRLGASGTWVAHAKLTVNAERVAFGGDWAWRVGARFFLTDAISVELGVARVGPHAARLRDWAEPRFRTLSL